MAMITERVETLKKEYTFEEISHVYHTMMHHMSLRPGVKNSYQEQSERKNTIVIAKKLAERYIGNERNYYYFRKPAAELNALFDRISLDEIPNKMPKELEIICEKIAGQIKRRREKG